MATSTTSAASTPPAPAAKKKASAKPKKPKPAKTGYPISLSPFAWDRALVQTELADFHAFLLKNPEFDEKSDALPFFQARPHLCGFFGLCVGSLANPNRIAFELSLGGNYRPDFVVGCTQTKSALFVELEDGKKNSFFAKPGSSKAKLASRLLGAISQVVDWSFQLTQLNESGYKALLGFKPNNIYYLIVSGRKAGALNPVEALRYEWVTNAVTVDSRPVQIQTYDDVHGLIQLHAPAYGF